MPQVRVFTDTAVLTVEDEYFEVFAYFKDRKLKKGCGYVKGDYVYVYRGKLGKVSKDDSHLLPGIYLNERTGEHEFIEYDKESKKDYHVSNVTELNLDKILKDVSGREDQFIDPDDVEIINNNKSAWSATLQQDDDFLKRAIKLAVNGKGGINPKNYRNRLESQWALNNLISGLKTTTKMTVPNFLRWCEILGIEWSLRLEDNGTDKISPLEEPIELNSEDF